MSFARMLKRHWQRLKTTAERVWAWHHAQMQASGRYARTVIQGVIRAIWQPTLGRYLTVMAMVIAEVLRVLGEDGFAVNGGHFD